MSTLPAFKAYDVRGKIPEELNEDLVYKIGVAYANQLKPEGAVATGRDVRDSSVALQQALNRGLTDAGVDVVDIGLCGTETIYFASGQPGITGGIMITASHNPKGYNGVKPVGPSGRPLLGEDGLAALQKRIIEGNLETSNQKGQVRFQDYLDDCVNHFLSLVPQDSMAKAKLVANPGNGCAGPTAKVLMDKIGLDVDWVHFEPDETFPNGIPNPLLVENRASTAEAVLAKGADLGIAWDGDFDRCFFFDAKGQFIEGYYLVGLLAEAALEAEQGGTIIHDPRLYWNTQAVVQVKGGKTVKSRTGHAFIKQAMREHNGIYGGEMSAHHYFREFFYCDSGMLPWMMLLRVMQTKGQGLSELVEDCMKNFPCSGEINFKVSNPPEVLSKIEETYGSKASLVEKEDGLNFEFSDQWRFNLRASNTEPLIRLNVESRGDSNLMQDKTNELKEWIEKLA